MSADQAGVGRVGELARRYEAWQGGADRADGEGPARLLALVEAVRQLCLRDGSIDQETVAALRESTGLDFRVEGDAVLFELADDNNPGKTQTIAVRAAQAGIE